MGNSTLIIPEQQVCTQNVQHELNTLVIQGGKPLYGQVTVRGAKNSLPKVMVAALLTSDTCVLKNVSNIQDVHIVSDMISAMGGKVRHLDSSTLEICAADIHALSTEEFARFSSKSRIPILLCGPILHRLGEALVAQLGGCNIGSRPVNFHIDALQAFGARIQEEDGIMLLRKSQKKLSGCKIRLEYPSVGATEQVLLTAVLADGVTELSNAAVEPEIIDLITVLQKMGAIISVDTDRTITIVGVNRLNGFEHTAMPDRLEAASWACVAIATDGKIFVRNARQLDMITFLNKFRQIGGAFEVQDDGITFWREKPGVPLNSISLETDVHPGFQTDWQQPFVVALTQAQGASIVHETVYENRFGYIDALNRMGAQIQLYRECLGGKHCRFGQRNHLHSCVIIGPKSLTGSSVHVPDLRAGFSYIVAALLASGKTEIHNMITIQRGYENIIDKLNALGADVVRQF